jgi:hypothetical protein
MVLSFFLYKSYLFGASPFQEGSVSQTIEGLHCESIKIEEYCKFFDNQCRWKNEKCIDTASKKPLALSCYNIKLVVPDFKDCKGKKEEDIVNIRCEIIPWLVACKGFNDCEWVGDENSGKCQKK